MRCKECRHKPKKTPKCSQFKPPQPPFFLSVGGHEFYHIFNGFNGLSSSNLGATIFKWWRFNDFQGYRLDLTNAPTLSSGNLEVDCDVVLATPLTSPPRNGSESPFLAGLQLLVFDGAFGRKVSHTKF